MEKFKPYLISNGLPRWQSLVIGLCQILDGLCQTLTLGFVGLNTTFPVMAYFTKQRFLKKIGVK